MLLAHALGTTRAGLLARDALPADAAERFEAWVTEREREARPVAYLLGRRGFRELDLAVDERVLVPRPESEIVVDVFEALESGGALPPGPVADVGTGSGNLALAACTRRAVLAVELSAAALEVAAANVMRHGLGRGLQLVRSDGLGAVRDGALAAVLSNPPYVEAHELATLQADVRDHEPHAALVPTRGTVAEHYAALARQCARALAPGGWWITELGSGQAAGLSAQLATTGWTDITITPDLAGLERVVSARRPG